MKLVTDCAVTTSDVTSYRLYYVTSCRSCNLLHVIFVKHNTLGWEASRGQRCGLVLFLVLPGV
jgi:hypothetical protein